MIKRIAKRWTIDMIIVLNLNIIARIMGISASNNSLWLDQWHTQFRRIDGADGSEHALVDPSGVAVFIP
ncbi:PH and sec7 domain-containing protein 4 [Plakobranchus ocellatus]|uniref:PH and sec7 domain-containing protein 4 n=1 Tax=Plakobranchus ocellatus TaxID=259542 RepID=A0AAV3Z382_9GAST|nr:PH and sec7 domain-containing protein 4 [Plakobranchus ocellatus]